VPVPPTANEITVVVPLHDHGSVAEVRNGLASQTVARERWEVLVVAPEEREDWRRAVTALADDGVRARYLESPPAAGRSGALNRGIRETDGEIVVLLADDIAPVPDFLAEHLAVHEDDPRDEIVAIGPSLFPVALRTDPFRCWLEDTDRLFGFPFTDSRRELPRSFFYCANASFKRAFLLGDRLFDERLPHHAVDDFELGKRLRARGMEAVYARRAIAWHHHPVTLAERVEVMRLSGESMATFDAIYPAGHEWNTRTNAREPTTLMWLDARRARLLHALRGAAHDREIYYERVLRRAFIQGLPRGQGSTTLTACE
jgi:GT2 family glycosyltransferase